LLDAIQGRSWAFARRWFVRRCVGQSVKASGNRSDQAERVSDRFGGWVDPNCLMFDKIACKPVIRWWSIPLPNDAKAMSADRHVYDALQRMSRQLAPQPSITRSSGR
jgi:hypothetical protein